MARRALRSPHLGLAGPASRPLSEARNGAAPRTSHAHNDWPRISSPRARAPRHEHANEPGPPPQIILYLENILEECEDAGTTFGEEVRRTYLHELGHYLGLDEEALAERDLD